MKYLLKYIKNKKGLVFLILITTLYEVFASTITPKILSKLIDFGIKNKNVEIIKKDGTILFVISMLSIFINILSAYMITKLGFSFTDFLSKKMFKKVQNMSFEDLSTIDASSMITRITKDCMNIGMLFTGALRNIIIFPFVFAFALYFAFTISVKLTTIAIIIIPIIVLIVVLVGKIMHKIYTKLNKEIDHMNLIVKENILGIKDIKVYTLENEEIEKFGKSNKKIKKYSDETVKSIIIVMPIVRIIIYFLISYILWLGSKEISYGNLETGQLIALIMYFGQIVASLVMISNVLKEFFGSLSSYKRIDEILSYESKKFKNENKKSLNEKDLDISLKNISVKKEDKYILKNINLDIPFGTSVGIIGNTGSSKTSLINVITRVLKETEGKMFLGDDNIYDFDEKEYLKNISYIPQKLVMISGNIKENLTMGKNIEEDEIIEALEISESMEFIQKYKDGIMHEVKEGGTNFSGGQKQRINIARGIIRKPKIMILDDSTSAIDIDTEKRIWKNINEKLGKITKIIISQKINSIKDLDKIIVMDNGKISNIGSHDYLIQNDKIYKKIYDMQK